MMPTICISPQTTLQDEKVCIRAIELNPLKDYTLAALLKNSKIQFMSYAHFRSNILGVIDVCDSESLGGHYTGTFQMGLISALQALPSQDKHYRFYKTDVEVPNTIEIRLYDGHITAEQILSNHPCIVNEFHYRRFMASGVQRIPVREGNVRATLFIPSGNGPFPGVIDMFGSAGGLLEYRSAQLASRGIISLALAYFDFEDLPIYVEEFDLNYFREAVNFFLKQEKLLGHRVGVIGVSKGGDLALAMSTFIPEVSLAIVINGAISPLGWPTKINEEYNIPKLTRSENTSVEWEGNIVKYNNLLETPEDNRKSIIPIHMSDSHFFFLVSEDDLNLNSKRYAEIAEKYMIKAGKSSNLKVRTYKGAGHLLEPPYSPFCYASYNKLYRINMAWGGELKAHTTAQEDAWIDVITYINEHLNRIESKL